MSILNENERRIIADYLTIPEDEVRRVEFFIEMKLTGKFPADPDRSAE